MTTSDPFLHTLDLFEQRIRDLSTCIDATLKKAYIDAYGPLASIPPLPSPTRPPEPRGVSPTPSHAPQPPSTGSTSPTMQIHSKGSNIFTGVHVFLPPAPPPNPSQHILTVETQLSGTHIPQPVVLHPPQLEAQRARLTDDDMTSSNRGPRVPSISVEDPRVGVSEEVRVDPRHLRPSLKAPTPSPRARHGPSSSSYFPTSSPYYTSPYDTTSSQSFNVKNEKYRRVDSNDNHPRGTAPTPTPPRNRIFENASSNLTNVFTTTSNTTTATTTTNANKEGRRVRITGSSPPRGKGMGPRGAIANQQQHQQQLRAKPLPNYFESGYEEQQVARERSATKTSNKTTTKVSANTQRNAWNGDTFTQPAPWDFCISEALEPIDNTYVLKENESLSNHQPVLSTTSKSNPLEGFRGTNKFPRTTNPKQEPQGFIVVNSTHGVSTMTESVCSQQEISNGSFRNNSVMNPGLDVSTESKAAEVEEAAVPSVVVIQGSNPSCVRSATELAEAESSRESPLVPPPIVVPSNGMVAHRQLERTDTQLTDTPEILAFSPPPPSGPSSSPIILNPQMTPRMGLQQYQQQPQPRRPRLPSPPPTSPSLPKAYSDPRGTSYSQAREPSVASTTDSTGFSGPMAQHPYIQELLAGVAMIKHNSKTSGSVWRTVVLSPDFQDLFWHSNLGTTVIRLSNLRALCFPFGNIFTPTRYRAMCLAEVPRGFVTKAEVQPILALLRQSGGSDSLTSSTTPVSFSHHMALRQCSPYRVTLLLQSRTVVLEASDRQHFVRFVVGVCRVLAKVHRVIAFSRVTPGRVLWALAAYRYQDAVMRRGGRNNTNNIVRTR